MAWDNQAETPGWPWILDCDPDYEGWTLASEMARQSRRTWRIRLLLATAATSVLLMLSLALSADARRTTCRAPGLRSLCAAVGIGDVPTPAEQALWDEARTQRSGDGLRAYLRRYPAGAYADEARARLVGCTIERVETPGPERDIRYAWTVNPIRARPLRTEGEARSDAVTRGNQDAATTCEPYQRTATVLSALARPRDWNCTQLDHGFACGFDGEIVCRLRDRIQSDHERCRDEDGVSHQ